MKNLCLNETRCGGSKLSALIQTSMKLLMCISGVFNETRWLDAPLDETQCHGAGEDETWCLCSVDDETRCTLQ